MSRHSTEKNLNVSTFSSFLNSQQGSIMGALGLGGTAAGLASAALNMGSSVSAAANRTTNTLCDTARDVESAPLRPAGGPGCSCCW